MTTQKQSKEDWLVEFLRRKGVGACDCSLCDAGRKKLARAIRQELLARLPEEKEITSRKKMMDWFKGGFNDCLAKVKEIIGGGLTKDKE